MCRASPAEYACLLISCSQTRGDSTCATAACYACGQVLHLDEQPPEIRLPTADRAFHVKLRSSTMQPGGGIRMSPHQPDPPTTKSPVRARFPVVHCRRMPRCF